MSTCPCTQATLAALGALAEGPIPPHAAAAALERFGDAIRLELDPPRALRTWLRGLSDQRMKAALGEVQAEMEALTVPANADDLDGLEIVVLARDRSESAMRAACWAALVTGRLPRDLPGFAELRAVQRALDALIPAGTPTRALLGERAVMSGQ